MQNKEALVLVNQDEQKKVQNSLKKYQQNNSLPKDGAEKIKQQQLGVENQLRTLIKQIFLIPVQIEKFYWTYALLKICVVIKLIACLPLALIKGGLDSIKSIFKHQKIKHTGLFACLIILSYPVIMQNIAFFDISFLYHSLRGQSNIKLYGLSFVLEISQKILTMIGQFLFEKLEKTLKVSFKNYIFMIHFVLLSFLYTLVHWLSIYFDFILLIIVLNTSMGNFAIFCFVINLTKMKSTAFKKFQKNNFRSLISHDAKVRIQNIFYILFFKLTQIQKQIPQLLTKLLLLFLIGTIIDYFKHATILTLAHQRNYISELNRQIRQSFFKKQETEDVLKFIEWDFTVIPYCIFVIKMISIVLWANWQPSQYNKILFCIYLFFCLFSMIITPKVYKYIENLNQQIQNEN